MRCLVCGRRRIESKMRPGGTHILSGQGLCFNCAEKELFNRGIISYDEYMDSVEEE